MAVSGQGALCITTNSPSPRGKTACLPPKGMPLTWLYVETSDPFGTMTALAMSCRLQFGSTLKICGRLHVRADAIVQHLDLA